MAYTDRKKKKKEGPKVNIGLDVEMVDLMIEYVLSDSPLINIRSIINLKKLLDRITFDDDVYESRVKFNLLREILSKEIDNNIFNYPILKVEVKKKFTEDEEFVEAVMEEALDQPIIEADILYINEYVEEKLTYFYIYESKDKLKNAIEEVETSNNIEGIIDHFQEIITGLYKDIQNSKATQKDAASDFSIGGQGTKSKNFIPMVKRTIEDLNMPSNHIRTGVKALNDILGGGLENGRCYLAYAPPKSWKSGLLMNMAIWAAKYNTFIPRDPSKKPTILFVSAENTTKDTIKRLFSYATGKDIKDFSYEEATEAIAEEIIGDRNIEIEIRYRKNKSISTTDLDAMIDELALEGKEVVVKFRETLLHKSMRNPGK